MRFSRNIPPGGLVAVGGASAVGVPLRNTKNRISRFSLNVHFQEIAVAMEKDLRAE